MTKRERILAIAVGALVVLGLIFFVGTTVLGTFTEQTDRITQLESDNNNLYTQNQIAERKARKIKDFEKRALPFNREEARRIYQKWLIDLAKNEVAFKGVEVKPGGEQLKKIGKEPVYRQLSFTLVAQGTLEQLTKFLYRYHKVNLTQRIASMRVTPIRESKDLKISLRTEALSVPGAPSGKPIEELPGDRLRLDTLADYNKTILERNLFGPQNNPPRFRPPSSERGYKGRSLEIKLSASDEDKLDSIVAWEMTEAPEGARFSSRGESAAISWTPRENGEYKFVVAVTDDGIPARTSTGEISVTITDPPPPPKVVVRPPDPPDPPKPKFNVAKYTVLSFIAKGRDGREFAWLYQRPTDKMVKRAVGEEFEIGLMTGKITSIENGRVTFESEDKQYELNLGDILAEAEPISAEQGPGA